MGGLRNRQGPLSLRDRALKAVGRSFLLGSPTPSPAPLLFPESSHLEHRPFVRTKQNISLDNSVTMSLKDMWMKSIRRRGSSGFDFKEEYLSKIKKKKRFKKSFLKGNLCYLNWSPAVTW